MTTLRLLYILLLIAILWLQTQIWFGHADVFAVADVHHKLEALTSKNQKSQQRNRDLYRQIIALKGSGQAVEARARYDLGMIKRGEIYYQFKPQKG